MMFFEDFTQLKREFTKHLPNWIANNIQYSDISHYIWKWREMHNSEPLSDSQEDELFELYQKTIHEHLRK